MSLSRRAFVRALAAGGFSVLAGPRTAARSRGLEREKQPVELAERE